MSKKTLEQCKSGDDFYRLARRSENLISERQCGSHVVLTARKGSATVARHNGDMAKGTASALRKRFVVIGLAVLVVLLVAIL